MAHPTRRADDPQSESGWFPLRSLRAKLQLFSVLLVLVPGALIAVIARERAASALEQAVGRQLTEVAHDTLEQVTDVLAAERADMRTWARQDVMRDLRVGDVDKRVTRFLLGLRTNGSRYRMLLCTDRSGRVVASTDPAEVGGAIGGRPSIQAALAGTEFFGEPAAGGATGDATVEIAVPIHDPDDAGVTIGVLVGYADWGHAVGVVDRIRRTLLPHGLTVDLLVLDRAGRMLGAAWHEGATDEEQAARRAAAESLARAVSADRMRGYVSNASERVVVGFERGEQAHFGWMAIGMEAFDEAFRELREMERRLLVGLAAVLFGALVVATYFAERMSRPLRALTRATREIAHGTVSVPTVAARSHDEIGELATAFNGMAADLERAQDDLLAAAKFAFVGEVAAGVAHEIRTPLGILRSSAQMLERSVPRDRPETIELAGMMVEEVDRLDRVVDGLLELARPHEPVVEPTPLDTILGRALDFVEAQAREKGITLGRDFRARTPAVRCDPEQIYRVALNLIVNALQILGPGGHIGVRILPAHDGRVGFEVRDDGPGIPADVRERIFTPFFSMRAGGTGLGLALVQRVVHEHQGTVSVDSTVGLGTTFRVDLPAAQDPT